MHWVGMFLLLSKNQIVLITMLWNFFAIGDCLFCLNDASFCSISRSLAEFSRIPVVVTNQVRSQSRDEACQYSFQGWIA